MNIVIPAAAIEAGDEYDDEIVQEVKGVTDKGNISFKTDGGWRRRPVNEQLFVRRPVQS